MNPGAKKVLLKQTPSFSNQCLLQQAFLRPPVYRGVASGTPVAYSPSRSRENRAANPFSLAETTHLAPKRKPLIDDAPPPIVVEGARTHNLKSVSCQIPAGRLTVITGVSGSGKSSLAFETLFAEGQRRYVESLSTYARQFIARMPRPDVDRIDNIPPAIALEQKNSVRNARSTIGTATEINDYLRLIFAKAGRIVCPQSGEEVRRDSPATAAAALLRQWKDEAVYLLAPVRLEKKSMLEPTLKELLRQGFNRLFLDGEMIEMDQPGFKAPKGAEELRVVVDRLKISPREKGRLAEAIESAYRIARGRCIARTRSGEERLLSEELRCAGCPGNCGQTFREPSVQMLNFGSPLGACPTCEGFGRVTGIDWNKVIPDPTKTIAGGAIAAFSGESNQECLRDLKKVAADISVRLDVPWNKLTEIERKMVREGKDKWYGIKGFFDWLETKRYKVQARIMIARYRGYTECPDCRGTRLRKEAMAVRIGGLHIGEVCDLSVKELSAWINDLKLTKEEQAITARPMEELRARVLYLLDVGLGYLTLSRQTRTLSGGESQRINLATALGSALTETLYVLDEPTVGLHSRDTARLIGVLRRLTDLGNSVVVVEHDLDVIRAADSIIDIGPDAGERGGRILFQGDYKTLVSKGGESKTAAYLKNESTVAPARGSKKGKALQRHGRRTPTGWITVEGAAENNLRHVTARIPLGVLCCVTGVSGSGKSTLIKKCLYENYRIEYMQDGNAEPGLIAALDGIESVDSIEMIDQSPIGRSTRSNAATYLKAYDHIRNLLAGTPEADALGLKPRDFSFNVPGGRCETCEGTGTQTIDMHFLANVDVECEMCEGKRFQQRVLDVRWKGKNVSDILDMTVLEAIIFFEDHPRIVAGLDPLDRVGLGYLRLGQSTATLSGGEAQRLKLAAHIAGTEEKRNALLLFDEPTTGLHAADLDVLIHVFESLIDRGYSLVIIEHNMQLIRRADYVIDMGPEGGEEGGRIVVEGTPEDVAACEASLTGRFLRGG